MATTVSISVSLGNDNDVATIRKSNSSTPIVADVLGVETDEQNQLCKLYLRSKIHTHKDQSITYEGWCPSGAISTILTRVSET